MADCKPCTTSIDLQAKLAADSGPPVQDASQFRSIAGALQSFTRPDIAYVIQQICLHMHDPREPHLMTMKHILRYLQGRRITVSFCATRPALTSSSTPMLTGLDVRTLVALRPATRCSSGTTWCPGRPSDRRSSLGPARKSSIAPSPTV
jgi:hypothetical protein